MTPKGLIAVGIGVVGGVWCTGSALWKTILFRRAQYWPSVRGKITESVLYHDPARHHTMHFRVKYVFVLGDQMEGCTPRLAGDWFWKNGQQARFVARYKVGQEVEVYYDPRKPTRNCLDRTDQSGVAVLWLLGLGGLALAAALLWLDRV